MLKKLMGDLADEVSADLREEVEIVEQPVLDATVLKSSIPRWHATDDVVAVFADLKNSTRLGLNRHAKSSAKTYEAATGGAVQAMSAFGPAYIDIQGDGIYALFSGPLRYERALCAAVTVRTWSEKALVPALEAKFGERFPATGFKVGVAASRLLGKRVGVRGTHEPVWAGRAVNYAAKLAQDADRHEVLVTKRVYEHFLDNDFVQYSCGCGDITGMPAGLWTSTTSVKLPEGENVVHLLTSPWCDEHGDAFCDAISSGQKERPDVTGRVA